MIYPALLFFSPATALKHRVDNCTAGTLVGLIPSGWVTQLPIKIQLPRTVALAATTPNSTQTACSLSVRHRPPETNFLPETGRIILVLFVSWPMIHTSFSNSDSVSFLVCLLSKQSQQRFVWCMASTFFHPVKVWKSYQDRSLSNGFAIHAIQHVEHYISRQKCLNQPF